MSKPDLDAIAPEVVEVTIFNQTYRLRSKTDKEHVQQIANLVDERMRQISSQMTTHDALKIAILTALNIADEMQSLRNYYENESQPLPSESPTGEKLDGVAEVESGGAQSWFEDFFEAKVETKQREERLSSQVSAKLKSLRQTPEQAGIATEEDASD